MRATVSLALLAILLLVPAAATASIVEVNETVAGTQVVAQAGIYNHYCGRADVVLQVGLRNSYCSGRAPIA